MHRISVENLLNSKVAFAERIQNARGHWGQIKVAENLRKLLADSEIIESHKECGKVQDAYSSRCMPLIRDIIPSMEKDRLLHHDFVEMTQLISSERIIAVVEKAVGPL